MADTLGNSGIRAEGIRPVALLRKENYRAWSSKLKAQLKVMDCWRLVTEVELMPPAAAPAGSTVAQLAAAILTRASWDKRRDRAAAILITSISDEESHTVQAVDEDPVQIWNRLREKFERRSETEAETAQMNLLEFAHREGETANATIDRFETIVMICEDQGVPADENLQKRMLLARPADRYAFLKQNYLLAPVASCPDLISLMAQIRDIDAEFQKSNFATKVKPGQVNRADFVESAWGQGTGSGGARNYDRGPGRFTGRGGCGSCGRGNGGRGRDEDGDEGRAGGRDVTCYCCGQRGHIEPNCPKKDEVCRKCKKAGHLQVMCKASSDRASGSGGGEGSKRQPEAAQFDSFDSYMCEVTIGEELPEAMMVVVDIVGEAEQQTDKWLGDTGSSHHIKSTRVGMINVEKCPPGTKIRQVQGVVDVQEWGTVLLEVDGANGKRIMRLHETLIVPSINVNLFSLQRALKNGFLPVYDEVEGKCIIKKNIDGGGYSQVATMTVINGRATLDCKFLNNCDSNSGAMEALDLVEELPGEDDPLPPVDVDGGGGGGIPSGGGLLSDVDDNEDDSPEPEGVQSPKMSERENRGVPPLRLIEIMAAASETDDGGAPASYGEALKGPEGIGWKKAFDAEEASYLVELKRELYGVIGEAKGKSKHMSAKWHFIRKKVELGMVKLVDVRTELMGVDMLTKAVGLAVNMRLIGMSKCG